MRTVMPQEKREISRFSMCSKPLGSWSQVKMICWLREWKCSNRKKNSSMVRSLP